MGRLQVFASLTCVLLASPAIADPNDFKIYQLALRPALRPGDPPRLGNPNVGDPNYNVEANNNFRTFARQFAAGLTSITLSPPETLGHSGFAFQAELSVVDFGTQTVKMPTEAAFSGPMLIPSVHVRKGLPFSFELGARGSWIEKSRMGAGTLELKWAVNEGFTYLPDVAVRGSVTKLLNSRDFDLTAGGLDLGIGKQFAIGGMVTITPYVGWNLMFVGASTGNVDFNPTRTLAKSDEPTEQFRDVYIFDSLQAVSNSHNRFYGGARFIGGVLMIGAEFSYTVIGSFKDKATGTDRAIPAVKAGNFTIGLDF